MPNCRSRPDGNRLSASSFNLRPVFRDQERHGAPSLAHIESCGPTAIVKGQSVPQNSFPLPTGSIFSFATLGFSFRKRSRRGNRCFILRNAPNQWFARCSPWLRNLTGSTMKMDQDENTCGDLMRVIRIVSGGQTGVDRGALDFAISRGIEHGGWVPKGRKAEDGPVPLTYGLTETKTSRYAERTRNNVLDSDGTLIIHEGRPSGGTALTRFVARAAGKPLLVIDISRTTTADAVKAIRPWIEENGVSILNVAGPRESQRPGIYRRTRALLECLFGDPSMKDRIPHGLSCEDPSERFFIDRDRDLPSSCLSRRRRWPRPFSLCRECPRYTR